MADNNKLKIILPTPTSDAFLLTFTTNIIADNLDFTNTASLSGGTDGPAGSAKADRIQITELYSGGRSGSNSLTATKTAADGETPLPGATFRLLNVNKEPFIRGGNAYEISTGSEGTATFTSLPAWTFYVQEMSPPPGYLLSENPISDGIKLGSGNHSPVTFTNAQALGTVSFTKTGAYNEPLTGGTFKLAGTDYSGASVEKTASAVNGTVTFTNVPLGAYTITEVTPPQGHASTSATLTATVDYNEGKTGVVVTVSPNTLVNTPLPATVSFSKDGLTGEILSGGTFILTGTDYNDAPVEKTAQAENGVVTFNDVPIGTYTISETDPPNGYLQPELADILTVEVSYNESRTGTVVVIREFETEEETARYENEPALGTVSFEKRDRGGRPLSGGTFTLTGTDYSGRDVVKTATSTDGTVTFEDVPLSGDEAYVIRETVAPMGHLVTDETLAATVTYDGEKTGVVTSVSAEVLYNDPAPIPGPVLGGVEVLKTDEDGQRLSGATFALYDRLTGALVATAVSGADGVARFAGIPEGPYLLRELTAPAGYIPHEYDIDVLLTGTAVRTFTVVNKEDDRPTGEIEIMKTDEGGRALAGAEFTLYDASNEVVARAVSDANGRAVFTDIPEGRYTVTETRAPSGYIADVGGKTATVAAGQTATLTFVNKEDPDDSGVGGAGSGSIRINKTDMSGAPLAGAEFTLYDENGAAMATALSGRDGSVSFGELAAGTYTVRETAPPEGYELFSEPLRVTLDEGQARSYTLKNRLEDDPSGVGGWEDESPDPSGTLPKTGGVSPTLFMGAAGVALLAIGYILAKPRKSRRRR